MMTSSRLGALVAGFGIAFAAFSVAVHAQTTAPGMPTIDIGGEPSIQMPRPGEHQASAFITLTNWGDAPVRLIAAVSPVARGIEFRIAVATDASGQRRMIPEFTIAPHTSLVMGSETYFMEFVGLQGDLAAGDSIPATLRFDSGEVPASFVVQRAGDGTAAPAEGKKD